MPATDPWLWTTDDLVAELCLSRALFQAADCAVVEIPDPTTLEHHIRSQEITGATFLATLSSYPLHDELDLPQRTTLTSVVDLLRRRSSMYKQHAATNGVNSLDLRNESSLPSLKAYSDTTSAHDTERKRRKVTHLTTAPPGTFSHNPLELTAESTSGNVSEPMNGGGGHWDHLLRWQQRGGDEEIDLATEDDIEDEERIEFIDGAEEDLQDVPDEDDEGDKGAQGRSKLTPDQVVDIINERIDYYTRSWRPNKGAVRGEEIEYDPEAMWEEAQVAGQRQQLVERYETDLAYYRHRLDKLCDEIVKFPGSNVDKVRRQCSNLEVTIDSMELADWLLSIYKLEPVDDSGDDDPGISLELQGHNSAHISKPSIEIVDLGSPSGTSGDDREGKLSPARHTESAPSIEDDQAPPRSRYYTPDSVVAETIEPLVYTNHESAVPTRALPTVLYTSHGDEPEYSSIATVLRWKWADLVDSQDRKRIVSKVVSELDVEDRDLIRTRLKHVGKLNMLKEIPACLEMLSRGQSKMQGVLPRDLPKIVTFTRLFLSWWLCDDYFRQEPHRWQLEELLQCLQEGSPDPETFCDYVNTIMTTTFSAEALRHPERPSQAEIIEISDDDEPASRPANPSKNILNASQSMQQDFAIVLD
ncbi:Nn.00g067460.m01.CDS01 [Neocucurbitaria sp. VM-36]